MRRVLRVLALAGAVAGASLASPAGAATFVETFTSANEGAWGYGVGNESVHTSGGHPGAYLYEPLVDTFAPQPRTALGLASEFTGDYQALGVTAVGIDLITFDVDFSAAGRPLSLILYSDNGTPGNFSDDWGAYTIGPSNIPLPGEGWKAYDFAVPAGSASLPAGWSFIQFGPNSPPPTWSALITDVDQLRFFYGDPELFFIFQQWELGLDNPRITKDFISGSPGRVPTDMLLDRISPTQIKLQWSASPCPGATDYGVYEGTIGSWYSHTRVVCTDAGADHQATITPSSGNRYYLVVPRDADVEGSYGLDSDGNERPQGSPGVCRPAQTLGCP